MYSNQTYEVIKQRTLDNISLDIDKREGSILNTLSSANAMSLAKAYMDMSDILSIGFIEDAFGQYLDKRVSEFGIYRKQGQKATGQIKVTGKKGTVISNGAYFLCNDLRYVMLNDVVIGEEDDICYVEAEEVGYKYNLLNGNTFSLIDKIDGVESLINEEAFKNGIDIESDDDLRGRFSKAIKSPSTSGNKAHYEEWALEVNGVGRAVVHPRHNGNGSVKVMVIGNDNKPVSEDIVENVRLHIEENMPIGDITLTVATPTDLNVIIVSNVELKEGYELREVKAEFEAKLSDYIKTVTNELTYAKVYGLLANILGVEDISSLTLNGNNLNISIAEDKIVNISSIELLEVI